MEELNQGDEKAFGENAKSMIDSLLYAKLPPKLKQSVNMARLEKGTYEEIVADLERELELNALEESDDLPMATMASASTNQSNLLSNGINTNKDEKCSYCKATGHYYKSCPKPKKIKKWRRKMAKNHSVQLTHHVTHAGKRIIQLKDVAKALALTCVPKGHRQSKKMQMRQLRKANLKQPVTRRLLVQANPLPKRLIQKLILPRLQIHEYMSVRQYVISDPPIIIYSQKIEDTKGIPTVVWQQQMEKACIRTYKTVHNDRPDRFYGIDHTKDFETQFRPLPVIEDYNPQYLDPE